MNKFPMLVFAFGLPLLGFLILKDGSGTLYKSTSDGLSYRIIEPEVEAEPEVETVEEAVVDQDDAAETTQAADASEAVEAPQDDAPQEVAEAEPAVPVEASAEETTADEAPVAEALVADDGATKIAGLTAEEMAEGQKATRVCASCHQLARDRNGVGPHLVDLGGRTIGSIEGFRYSDALKALNDAGAVWTAASLEEWLVDPSEFAEGTKMKFQVKDAEKRRLIAGYLADR